MSRRRIAVLAGALAAVGLAAGCGADDFANEPRPPAPIELTAKVSDRGVVISPIELEGEAIGAGPANVTVANLSDEAAQLTFTGPTERTTDPIIAGGVLSFKLELDEGDYVVRTERSGVRPFSFAVGPERESSQNELLLP